MLWSSQWSVDCIELCVGSQILAQCLVRRDLFPGSDCLKWSSRKNLTDQIVEYSPDVACLQVSRTLLPPTLS